MDSFEDLKLDPDLFERLSALGFERPTAIQREMIPVVARGTNVVSVASAGSGKTLAYTIGLAARLDPQAPALQALVLRPTDDAAAATADEVNRLLAGRGLVTTFVRPRGQTAAHVATGSPSGVLAAVEHSAVKLDTLKTVVVDGLSAMLELGARDALETLIAQLPKEAQRVVLTSEINAAVEDWLERHARRARRVGAPPLEIEPLAEAVLEFTAAPRGLWLPVLIRLLEGPRPREHGRWLIRCRTRCEARQLADRLRVRGFRASADHPAAEIVVTPEDGSAIEPAVKTVSWGAPPDLASFRARIEHAARAIAFVEPRELAHLQQLAGTLSVRLSALKTALPTETFRSAQRTRDQLRDAARNRDLEPYMIMLEPLLDEFNPIQLAAAAAALLRERTPDETAPVLPAWTRLYFGVGRRDGVRPADLVGAITGESPVSGDRIGRIEIKDTYSSVEVAASVADQVIKSLAATTIRGRPANVRVFRE
jgi:ATP-dependent RNA helicase DeaD